MVISMEYIISDIHGEYDLFIKLLEKINFNKNDKMIICGDIFDKGINSIKLLKYIRKHDNIILIIGNHEYEFLKYYNRIMQEQVDEFDSVKVLKQINDYFVEETETLDWDDLYWLESCEYYYETSDYLCVHAGVKLNGNNEIIDPSDTDINYLVYDRKIKNVDVIINNSKCVFYGHTPTSYLCNDYKILTYLRPSSQNSKKISNYYKIHLDCGVYLGGILGCFCVDTCESIYVKK